MPASQLVTAGLVGNLTFGVEIFPERDSRYELRVEYDLTSLVMAPLRRGAAQDDLEAARFQTSSAVVQLGYEVRVCFYALQGAVQRLVLAQQLLDTLAAARDAAQALFDAGNIRQLDASSQIAAYERARVGVATLELEVAERREEVQRLLGLHGEQTDWQIDKTLLPAPDRLTVSDDLERRALVAAPERRCAARHAGTRACTANVGGMPVEADGGRRLTLPSLCNRADDSTAALQPEICQR